MSNTNNRPNHQNQRFPVPKPKNEHSVLKTSGNFLRVIVTLGVCIFLAIFLIETARDLFGLDQKDKRFEVTIIENATLEELSEKLVENKIIDKKLIFEIYASFKKDDVILNPGRYVFNSNMAYDEIFTLMRVGDISKGTVRLSFREGISTDEIAQTLEEYDVCKADEFLEHLQTADFRKYSFFNKLPKDNGRYLRLEGYIFPDTYDFYVNEKVSSVADKFLSNTERVLSDVNLNNRMKEIGMDMDEVIILASIIEKEANLDENRRVSSVFHNRLDNSGNFPNLQSDVTIDYVEEHIKNIERSYTAQPSQEIYDAYNTYVAKGLPVGPVANPGEESITAALNPAETNNYYFVTNVDGDYYFAATLAEHDANVAKAKSEDESGEGWVGGVKTREDGADAIK